LSGGGSGGAADLCAAFGQSQVETDNPTDIFFSFLFAFLEAKNSHK
jgi:hypothetical protein